jgi:hypothetical protein
MTLTLVSPNTSNFVKDFPGQNAVNCDRIDAAAGPIALRTSPLAVSFTPTLTADVTNPVLGTGGFTKGWYYQIFDQIYLWAEFRFGTAGFSFGTGMYIMNLPFAANNLMGTSNTPGRAATIGDGALFDSSSSAGRLPLTVHLRNSNEVFFGVRMNSGLSQRELRESGYIAWATLDGVSFSCRYQRTPTI